MSNAASALAGKTHTGICSVTDMGLCGMIALRGDLKGRALRKICANVTDAAFPDQGKITLSQKGGLAWMSPDEILLLVPYTEVETTLSAVAKALKGQHHLAVDVSDARARIALSGPYARDVMAKLAPVDLHADTFAVGDFRRSRLGQIAAAFWMRDDGAFEIVCFRSVAQYAFDLLVASVDGGPVGGL